MLRNDQVFRASVRAVNGVGNVLPQHSVVRYRHLITEFGALSGVFSSITESGHITAVKEP